MELLARERLVFSLFVVPVVVTAMGAFAGRGTMYPRFYFFSHWIWSADPGARDLLSAEGDCGAVAGTGKGVGKAGGRAGWSAGGDFAAGFGVFAEEELWYPKQDFDGALKFIESEKIDNGRVLTAGATVFPYQQYFGKPWQEVKTPADLEAIVGQGQPVWLVYTFPRYLEAAAPGLPEAISREFTVVRVFHGTLGEGDVVVVRSLPK